MKGIRRFGLMIVILLIGITIGHFGLFISILFVCPLITLWLLLWDDKKNSQIEYKRQIHRYQTKS
ncbi:hypothetical protein [Tetragenococcus halophilus]|uniref:Uncharacterized protein n=3 Tax=Tetragenococcus halophilus TaxID=51669 RepID=A0A2H6D3S3_TETHA|nr:hypothetical protein [Tetragenococcus halophilus]AYW50379.1 hypothetical protein C7H83_07860 [Tetragenococcus halophilus]MCF1601194.1 hypothetical protein [Tetragenococcus halophilus]MCF1675620.1 hypothetical protein [Tetragenococcus halophilus]MCO8284861.1 hypothetical protein [Tetragenococcus halophilus]MCO8285739.1 hypothetical protein [Tetragenococcus halophilus]